MNQNEHVTSLIGAYHDGELKGGRLKMVEEHLLTCEICREEKENLKKLSSMLQCIPDVSCETPPNLFVAQVGYKLARKPGSALFDQALQGGWRLAPAGLLGVWAFIQAAFIVTGILGFSLDLVPEVEKTIGLLPTQGGSYLIGIFSFFDLGVLNLGRFFLDLLGTSNLFGSRILLNLSLLTIGGLLYLSWLASWWVQKFNDQESNPSHLNYRRKGVN